MPKPDLAAVDETRRSRAGAAPTDPLAPAVPDETPSPESTADGRLDAFAARAADGAVELAKSLPAAVDEVASGTGRALGDAERRLQAGSDSGLLAGASLSAGLALGLLAAGAPRLAVVLALAPAAAFGLTLLQRRTDRDRLDRSLVN